LIGIPSLVLGIMALTSNSTDPEGSRRKARTGWIVFGINVAAVIVLVAIVIIIAIAAGSGTPGSSGNSGTY